MQDHPRVYEEVGRRVRDARKKRSPRLTQKELAELVSLTRTSITNIEKGRQKILVHTLVDIASALCIEPSKLLPPLTTQSDKRLNNALKGRTRAERDWIKATVSVVERERSSDGP